MVKQKLSKIYYTINIIEIYKKIKLKNSIKKYPEESDKSNVQWKKIFLRMLCAYKGKNIDNIADYWKGFSEDKLILIKEAKTRHDFSSPIIICTINNSYIYLKEFLPYYRNMGVKHFVLIDNNSSDETADFIKCQEDVTLFSAPYKFRGTVKAGWKLQALSYIGFNHWYLWLDSDEFLAYPNMESIKLPEYIDILENHEIVNVGGFMLDMYPEYSLANENANPDMFYKDYRFFDQYNSDYRFSGEILVGGMRGRLLNIYNLRLDKTPLIYCTVDNIPLGNHDTFPQRADLSKNYGCVLKHYKFLVSDMVKYENRAKNNGEGYANLDAQKMYSDLFDKSFIGEKSIEYINTKSLKTFPFLRDFTQG